MADVKELRYEDKPMLEEYLSKFHHEMWAMNAGYLYGYKTGNYVTSYFFYHDTLVLLYSKGKTFYLPVPPLNPDGSKLREVLDYVFNTFPVRLCESFPESLRLWVEDSYDLAFGVEEFICHNDRARTFSGPELKKKRNSVNKFIKDYDGIEIRPYDPSWREECLILMNKWKEQFTHHRNEKLVDSVYSMGMLDNWDKIGLRFDLVIFKNQLIAYNIGYAGKSDVWYHLVLKYDRSINGLCDFGFMKMANTFGDKQYVNQGPTPYTNPGLMASKKKFGPVRSYRSYVLIPKKSKT